MIQVELALQIQPDIAGQNAETVIAASPEPGEISEAQWQDFFGQWMTALNPQQSTLQMYDVSLLLTTDADIQQLNATYRQHDVPTDVLAFAALEWEGPVNPELEALPTTLGDIIISVETAERQATEHHHDLKTELLWLASHGLLHLLGWDHPDVEQLNQMLTQQAHLLTLIGTQPPRWSSQTLGYA